MVIDLRSDTVTRPGKEMLEYMMKTPVGDMVLESGQEKKVILRKKRDDIYIFETEKNHLYFIELVN